MIKLHKIEVRWNRPIMGSFKSTIEGLTKDEALEIAKIYNSKRKECKATIVKG